LAIWLVAERGRPRRLTRDRRHAGATTAAEPERRTHERRVLPDRRNPVLEMETN